MQRHQIAPFRFEIDKLVDVGHVGACNCGRAPSESGVRPDIPFGRMLVHRFSHHPFAHQDDADRTAVIVNRSTLSRAPAKEEHFGERAPHNKVPCVVVV